jgi:hypothetical protein
LRKCVLVLVDQVSRDGVSQLLIALLRSHGVLRRYGAAYLNSYETLKLAISGTDIDEYYWLTDNTHFSENGNEIWADAEVRFLLERKLLVEGN